MVRARGLWGRRLEIFKSVVVCYALYAIHAWDGEETQGICTYSSLVPSPGHAPHIDTSEAKRDIHLASRGPGYSFQPLWNAMLEKYHALGDPRWFCSQHAPAVPRSDGVIRLPSFRPDIWAAWLA
ncbi:hypothetical protein BD779DRAFT_1471923 [Infundibulicybe gibba]|nr:hypothetical protein BD779DRAFT_1471923 [Infundibulicybe gibba]